MTTLNEGQLNALRYVRNTNGGADKAIFVEDHEPVGNWLWDQLHPKYIMTDHFGRIFLTEAGNAALSDAKE